MNSFNHAPIVLEKQPRLRSLAQVQGCSNCEPHFGAFANEMSASSSMLNDPKTGLIQEPTLLKLHPAEVAKSR